MGSSVTQDTENGEAVAQTRSLGWWMFILQAITVIIAFIALAFPPILLLGQTSAGLALSAATSMLGGLVAAWLWLRRDRALAEAFDLSRPESWGRTLAWGLAATGAIIAIFAVGVPLVEMLGLPAPEVGGVMAYVTQSPWTFVLWIVVVAWLSAAFGEELLWRGFLMDRLSRLRGLQGRTLAVLLIHAAIFGLPHIYQGWGGVLITGVVGLFLGWLRLHMRGNLWAAVIAHGLVDTIMMSLGYMQALGWYGS